MISDDDLSTSPDEGTGCMDSDYAQGEVGPVVEVSLHALSQALQRNTITL